MKLPTFDTTGEKAYSGYGERLLDRMGWKKCVPKPTPSPGLAAALLAFSGPDFLCHSLGPPLFLQQLFVYGAGERFPLSTASARALARVL